MIAIIDTTVILDALLDRGSDADPALTIMNLVEQGKLKGRLAGTTMTTLHYLVQKLKTPKKAMTVVSDLLKLFKVVAIDHDLLENAVARGFNDFEAGVIHEAALVCKAEHIISRNLKDFKKSQLPVLTPTEFLAHYFPDNE